MDQHDTQLIVNGDDFGMTPGISAGVLAAHRNGILTSCSVLGNSVDIVPAFRLLRAAPELGVGLHLTLFGGSPVSAASTVPSLVVNGKFASDMNSLLFVLLRAREAEVNIEFDAQIRRALDVGLDLDHLDVHLHLDHLPAIARVITALAKRYSLRAERRLSERVRMTEMRNLRRACYACALKVLGAARRSGAHTGVTSVGFMHSGHLTEDGLYRLIADLPYGHYELICHPGMDDRDGTCDKRRIKYRPRAELDALVAPRIRRLVGERGIRLCRWRDLS